MNNTNASSDLLGLSTPPATQSQTGTLIDVLGDIYSTTNGTSSVINNAKKYDIVLPRKIGMNEMTVVVFPFVSDLFSKIMAYYSRMICFK